MRALPSTSIIAKCRGAIDRARVQQQLSQLQMGQCQLGPVADPRTLFDRLFVIGPRLLALAEQRSSATQDS